MKINSKKILEWTLGITIGIPFIALLITLGVSWFSLLSLCWTAMFLYRQSKTLGKKCQIAWQAFKDWLQQKPKAKPKKMMPQKRSVLIKPIKRKLIRPPIAKDITKSFDSPAELQTYLEEQGKEDAKNTIHYGKDLKTVLSFNLTPEIEAELSGCLLQQKLPCLIQIKTGEEAPQNHPQLLNIYLRNKRLYREKALQEAGYFGALKIDETESASRENISRAKINLATGHHEEHSGGLAFQRHMQHARQKQQQTEEQHATQSMLDARREQLAKRVIHKPHFQPTPKDTWHLINKENIKTYIVQSTNFSLQTIQPEVFWDELVGVNAGLVTSTYPERAITHVDKSAMQHIVSHFSEFRYGLVLDNLPHGFHLYKNDHQLILYYDKNTPDLEQDERETLKIAIPPVHVIPKGTVDALLRDTESANHSRMQAAYNIVMNDHTNDHHLEEDTKARQKAFIELITMSAPILPAEEILTKSADEWQAELDSLGLATHMHYQALTAALCASSRQSVIAFLNQLIILKAKDKTRYQHFKNTFLDTTDDFSDYMTPHAFYTIKELGNLSKVENIWWESLTHDHCISTRKANFNDLFQAFQYFLSRINEEHCTLPYRAPQKTKHMKIALDRLLTILDHAADKKEQCAEFGELDLSQEGAYYASREDFKLVSPEMRCSPDELIAKGNSEKWCFAMTDHMQDKIHQITCNRSEGLRGLLRKIKESSLSLEQQKVIRLIIIKQFGCGGYISAGGKFKYQCLGNDNKKLGRMLLVFRKTLPDPFATFLVATPTIADWPYFALHAPELWAIIIKNDKKFNQFIDALENDAAYNQLDPAIREIMDHYNPFDPALDKIFYSALDKTSYSYSRFYSSNNKEYYRNQAHKTHESYDTLPIHLKKMLDESIHGCITYVEDGRADIDPPIDLDESNYADRLLIARILNCSSFTITLQPEAPTQEEIQRAEREKRAVFSYIEQDVKQSEDQYNPFNIPLENFINRTYGENKKHFFRQMGLKEMALPLYFYRSLVNIISNHYYLQERVKFKNVHAGRTFVPTLANPPSDQDFVCRSFNNDSINPHANAVLHLLGLTSTTERQLKIGDNTEQITQLLEIIARHPEQSEESTDNEK
ncbi:MAG: LigA, interaptin, partial [uncultured bacterium]